MTPVLRRLWRRTVRRLGYSGPLAMALLLLAAVLVAWLPRLDGATRQLRAEFDARSLSLRSRGSAPPRQPGREERLAQYVEAFPLPEQMAADLRQIYASAERQHVELLKGEYQLKAEANSPFVAYVITLPIHADYGPVKAFTASVLQELPHASLDELRLSRDAADVEVLDAVVRFTLAYRSH